MKNNFFTNLFKIKSLLFLALISSIISFFTISCSKFQDNFDFSKVIVPDWNPEFAIPLINSTYKVSDFFGDSGIQFVKINPDKTVSLVYNSQESFTSRMGDVINIPQQNFSYQSPFIVPPLPSGSSYEIALEFPIAIIAGSPDQRLDSLILKGGTLHIAGQTNLNRNVTELSIKVPEIIHQNTGEPLTMIASLNNPGGQQSNVNFDINVPIGEYKFIFDNRLYETRNKLNFKCSLKIQGDNNPDQSPYNFSIGGSFNNLDFTLIYGYLGKFNLSLTDSLPISLFEKTIGGGIQLGPSAIDLFIDIKNQVGMPVTFGSEYFYAYSKVNDPGTVDIYMNGPGWPNIFNIQSPGISQVGQTVETHLNLVNNNLDEAFNIAPDKLFYKFIGVTNPGNDTLASNFVTDTSRISGRVAVEFQLFASISQFIIQDTIDFHLDNVKEVDHILFRINATNSFPLNANVQLYFTDDNFNVLDSLITDNERTVLPGAPVGGPPDYRVTGPAHDMTDANLTHERIQHLLDAKYMILRAGLSTTNEQLIKIYDDYSLKIQIGTIAGINIENN